LALGIWNLNKFPMQRKFTQHQKKLLIKLAAVSRHIGAGFNKENKKVAKRYLLLVLLLVAFFVAPALASADVTYPETPTAFDNTAGLEDVKEDVYLESGTDIRLIIVRLINVFIGLLGLILLGLIIYGGWLYMTSEGDSEKTNKAKEILKNAAIGLLIILSAFAIVNFILRALWGGGGGLGRGGEPTEDWNGVVALGDGILESHYPERDQTDVPINTMIFITFKEEIQPGTICNDATADGGNGNGQCDNEILISKNIHIYPTDAEGSDAQDTNALRRADGRVLVKSNDNKTFIFQPLDFLGTQGAPAWFAVKLMGDGEGGTIKKVAGDKPVEFSSFGDDYYKWKFQTNGKLDLTPPQVSSVFPPADNDADIISAGGDAAAATGSITVNAVPRVYQAASKGNAAPGTGAENAAVLGEYSCDWAGEIEVSINGGAAIVGGPTGATGLITGDSVADQTATLGCGLTLQPADGSFAEGNFWTIAVKPEIQADTLTIGDKQFVFVDGTAGNGEINRGVNTTSAATNIKEAIKKAGSLAPDCKDSGGFSCSVSIISLTAKTAGLSGNNIRVESNNAGIFTITTMHGGAPATERVRTAGLPDQPRNAVIQINFNEAVNPIYVNGTAEQVKDYVKVQNRRGLKDEVCDSDSDCFGICEPGNPNYKCGAGGVAGSNCTDNSDCLSYNCQSNKCVGEFISGSFTISNIYKTVEFTTDNQCGVNACGEAVYCLPPLSDIKVSLKAASLIRCENNDECLPSAGILGDYNSCSGSAGSSGFCQKTGGDSAVVNYPQADLTVAIGELGVMDAANNSLDGNKNGNAEGPQAQSGKPAFNENNKTAGNGDDYTWSFWTSNILDLNSPIIQSVKSKKRTDGSALDLVKVTGNTGKQVLGADNEKPVSILFNKLIMSSSVKPGRNYGDDDVYVDTNPPVQKEYLIMMNYSGRPLGYWCSKEDSEDPAKRDGYADWTTAVISHTQFRDDSSYGSLAGSGIKDIYQNCYNPAKDQAQGGSQCNGALNSGDSCCKGVIIPSETDGNSNNILDKCREFE